MFALFKFEPPEQNRPIQLFLSHFMHQNGLPQSVSQLALQARERARAWRRRRRGCGGGRGGGPPPGSLSPQTERWKQVRPCGNAAVMSLETQQAAVTLLERLPQSSDIAEIVA